MCSVEACDKVTQALSLCPMHYKRLKVHGDVDYAKHKKELHGMSYTDTYNVWHGMIQRCTNRKGTAYKNYGGRGITVCEKWTNSFLAFFKDMGEKPKYYSIDRIDNDGNYEPSNCRWASKSEQCMNTRIRSDNTSGYRGIVMHRQGVKRWQSKVYINGVPKSLGYYLTAAEANIARLNFQTVNNRE